MQEQHEIRSGSAHLCCDMQRMFAEKTEWHTPWMNRIRPRVVQLAQAHPAETIYTRFWPARSPGQGQGTWKPYYERWASMTIDRLGESMVNLIPELEALVPPGEIIDKTVYSPWLNTPLHARLQERRIDRLVISGAETDVCVLATTLGAVDLGYRVIVASDAVCSSADETHDASLQVYRGRFAGQIEIATAEQILERWPGS